MMYLHSKMNFLGQGFQKLEHYTQTDRCDQKRCSTFAGGKRIKLRCVFSALYEMFLETHRENACEQIN